MKNQTQLIKIAVAIITPDKDIIPDAETLNPAILFLIIMKLY